MDSFFEKVKAVLVDRVIVRRILFTLAALIIFQFLASIPIPGVDRIRLASFFANNEFLGLLNVFSGGGLSNLSIVMLGVSPFITASIIMNLLTMMSPKLKQMYQEEGEAGRKRFSQYARIASVPLAIISAFGFILLLEQQGVVPGLDLFALILNVMIIVGGTMVLLWLGELITEFGIGNGVSLIIFAGIVAALPRALSERALSYIPADLPIYIFFAAVALLIIYAVVYVTEAERPVPVTYAKRVRGNKVYGGVSTYLPLRLTQAGVIPIIFALSILLFPQLILNFLSKITISGAIGGYINSGSQFLLNALANQLVYGIAYFVLVFLFTYFYTAVTFDPDSISKNLQQNGAFIAGVRPGEATSSHLSKIILRITFAGALFLGIIAVLPLIFQGFFPQIGSIAIGGTALLIVVSVVLDLIKKIEAQISMREY
jgi:preprotein translocase subunit SecY